MGSPLRQEIHVAPPSPPPPPETELVYKRNEQPRSTHDWCLYSFQWLVTMVYAVVWGYAIVGVGLNFQGARMTTYISSVVLTIGLSTLLQAWIGHRMAMVHGPNVIPSLAIVAAFVAGGESYALQSFAAQAIAGLIIVALVYLGAVRYIRKVWSPLVLGSMIMMIGLTVAAVGLGDMTQAGFGLGFFIALALALGGTVLAIRGRGVWATLPPVFVIVLGYLIFLAFGRVDLNLVRQAPVLSIPTLFPYGRTLPSWDLVLIMLIVNLMAAMNFYGNLHGYAGVIKEKVKDSEERRSFLLFGLVETILPGVLGTPATVAYGENLGIVQLTRVAARAFVIVAAAIFIVLAFIGPFGALMAVMPKEVAGAVLKDARKAGLSVVHCREGHIPDLTDCAYNKLLRSKIIGKDAVGIGEKPKGGIGRLLLRGSESWGIVKEVEPIEGEILVDKAGKGVGYCSDFFLVLQQLGISHLILCGITTDVCVHTIMREANDIGYWCLLLRDCVGATDIGNHESAIHSVKMQGGVFGWVSDTEHLHDGLKEAKLVS